MGRPFQFFTSDPLSYPFSPPLIGGLILIGEEGRDGPLPNVQTHLNSQDLYNSLITTVNKLLNTKYELTFLKVKNFMNTFNLQLRPKTLNVLTSNP